MHHHAIARTFRVVGNQRNQAAFGFIAVLKRGTVHQQRVVAHHADLQSIGHHAVGHGWARSEVLPFNLELNVFETWHLGQVLFNQAEFFQYNTASYCVGGGVLCTNSHRDHFGQCWK